VDCGECSRRYITAIMSQKVTKDSGDVAAMDKTKQRRTIRVEKQQHSDRHGSARDVKHVKSSDSAKVLLHDCCSYTLVNILVQNTVFDRAPIQD